MDRNVKLTAKQIQIEMLADRGYTIPEKELTEKLKKLTLNQTYTKNDLSLYVYYLDDSIKLIDNVDFFNKKMKRHHSGIIVGSLNDLKKLLSKKYINQFDKLKTIQFFSYDELQYNVSKHTSNGSYEKSDYKFAHANEYIHLLFSDPIVKYYGFNVGDIIKMTEDNIYDMINDKTISYAIVINQSI